MKHTNWYKDAIIYQIYPRSFKDSNGDGLGDIPGIISKLDYLKELGINCVWLSPVYDSPQSDNGYDIANYRDIWKPFGNLNDFKLMLNEMHKRGIRLIMDLVVNHTSSEHEWFKQAIADKNSPYRDYYIIRKGKNNGKKPPNNWTGFFSDKAWERIGDTEDYYLHLFDKGQPDLNWENPKLRQEVVDIIRYWLDMGVDGFRCDVINLISKKQDFKSRFPAIALTGKDAYINGPRLHEFLHELYEKAYADYDAMTVGETCLTKIDEIKKLVGPDREELSMAFNFDHTDSDNYLGVKYLYRDFKLTRLKKRLSKYQYSFADGSGWNSLFIENHDQRRSVGRFHTCDKELRVESAKMLGTMYFFLQGTPFIYQGQELGMTNTDYTSIDDYQDVELKNIYNMCKKSWFYRMLIGKHIFDTSRDNARTPMQWDDSEYAGFSDVKPWLIPNGNKSFINANEALEDENSIFHYYQKLIEIRKNYSVVKNGKYELLDKNNNNVFSYTRTEGNKQLLVVVSFASKNVKNPSLKASEGMRLILSNYQEHDSNYLKPYEARVYYKD